MRETHRKSARVLCCTHPTRAFASLEFVGWALLPDQTDGRAGVRMEASPTVKALPAARQSVPPALGRNETQRQFCACRDCLVPQYRRHLRGVLLPYMEWNIMVALCQKTRLDGSVNDAYRPH